MRIAAPQEVVHWEAAAVAVTAAARAAEVAGININVAVVDAGGNLAAFRRNAHRRNRRVRRVRAAGRSLCPGGARSNRPVVARLRPRQDYRLILQPARMPKAAEPIAERFDREVRSDGASLGWFDVSKYSRLRAAGSPHYLCSPFIFIITSTRRGTKRSPYPKLSAITSSWCVVSARKDAIGMSSVIFV